MKKTHKPKTLTDKARLAFRTETIKNLDLLSAVSGGRMMNNPRTDCICCKACATQAC